MGSWQNVSEHSSPVAIRECSTSVWSDDNKRDCGSIVWAFNSWFSRGKSFQQEGKWCNWIGQCLMRSNILNYLILQLHSMFSSTLTITIKLILNQWGLTPMWRVIPSYRNLLSGSLWEHAAMYGVSLARQPHPEPGSIHSTDPLCLRALAWWPDVWPDVQMHLRCLRCCLHYHPSVPGSWGHCQCLEGSWFDGENSHFNAC